MNAHTESVQILRDAGGLPAFAVLPYAQYLALVKLPPALVSGIPAAVVDLAMETGRPDKVCGIHFFNPAPVMSLVEVVRPITASDETMAAARVWAGAARSARRILDPHAVAASAQVDRQAAIDLVHEFLFAHAAR